MTCIRDTNSISAVYIRHLGLVVLRCRQFVDITSAHAVSAMMLAFSVCTTIDGAMLTLTSLLVPLPFCATTENLQDPQWRSRQAH